MKKILLSLMLCYSYLFSAYTAVLYYEPYYIINGDMCAQKGALDYINDLIFCPTCPTTIVYNEYTQHLDIDRPDGESKTYSYFAPYVDFSFCSTPPITCDQETEDLVDGQCVCKSGFILDTGGEGCIPDCSLSTPEPHSVPNGWVSYVDTYNEEVDCQARANLFPFKEFSFSSIVPDTNYPNCVHTICDVNEFESDPCNDSSSINLPQGYIYKGAVTNELVCRNFVDGINYLNYQTEKAYPDCSSATDTLYCYLLPNLDNEDSGIPLPDSNETNPDGTYTTLPPSIDSNTSDYLNALPSDSVAKSNALIGQLTGDFKDYFEWQKNSNGTYEKALTDFGRDFLKGQDTLKMNNDNVNTDKIVTAVNNSKINLTPVEDKLDTLIGDTADTSGQALSDAMSTLSNLQDINSSLSSSTDDDNTTTYEDITNTALSAYDNFETEAQAELTKMIDSIDYGISDMFNVGSYDFVDYPISVTLPMTNTKLEGNLMSADFLNSLDFSLGRLALLLATLVFCVYYVINRLFS